MPNHIINIINIDTNYDTESNESGADFKEITEKINGKDDDDKVVPIDFSKIIPVPKKVYQGDLGEEERKKYGENNWYDWNTKNWGTKWNAYDCWSDRWGKIIFKTAWSHPFPIIKSLSKMFPNNIFKVAYSDEDTGYNLGIYKMVDGKVIHQVDIKEGSEDAVLIAESLWGASRD